MSDAPKKIYLQWDYGRSHPSYEITWCIEPVGDMDNVEYIRKDIADADNKRLREALEDISNTCTYSLYKADKDFNWHNAVVTMMRVADAALEKGESDE